ncbi:MAG: lipid II flippase MurJ, partial [Acidimicrobiia bacterium]
GGGSASHRPATSPAVPVSQAATAMGAATALSRLLGFGRVLVVAAVLGTTDLGNTFSGANSVSNVFFDLLAAGALSAVLVPAFVELLDAGADDEAEELGSALLGRAMVVLVPLCAAGIVAAPALARVLVAGTDSSAVAADQRQLATFLLRLFIPQVLLYAYGAVATAVLHAQRRFVVTAVAPIGNTLVMVFALLAFRALSGSGTPSFDLTGVERLTLAAAGTLGVAAFVGVPAVALRRAGFRLGMRLAPSSASGATRLRRALRLSGWAGLQHAGTGVLLGSALLVGMGVTGGVVAYQVAFACFLVPYAVFGLPAITAVLPELAGQAAGDDRAAFGDSLRWALGRMVMLLVPVTGAAVVFAPRLAEALAFGETSEAGGRLIGVAGATLAVGLVPYGAFLLLVRACYALGEGRAPAAAALGSALLGATAMGAVGTAVDGTARMAVMGGAHSLAYLAGALVLGRAVSARTGQRLVPGGLGRVLAVTAVMAAAAALVLAGIDPQTRTATVMVVSGLLGAGGAACFLVLRLRVVRA